MQRAYRRFGKGNSKKKTENLSTSQISGWFPWAKMSLRIWGIAPARLCHADKGLPPGEIKLGNNPSELQSNWERDSYSYYSITTS